jgi:hypothetical protein
MPQAGDLRIRPLVRLGLCGAQGLHTMHGIYEGCRHRLCALGVTHAQQDTSPAVIILGALVDGELVSLKLTKEPNSFLTWALVAKFQVL